jgi:hypothetical protein
MSEHPTAITNQEELKVWVREQFQRANKHLAENGILFDSVVTEESRYLAPYVAVWKIKANDKKYYWVISGDVPCDFMPYESEKTAREAIRRFSFIWQIKAENIMKIQSNDKLQQDFAKLLINKAESLYNIQSDDKVWEVYSA